MISRSTSRWNRRAQDVAGFPARSASSISAIRAECILSFAKSRVADDVVAHSPSGRHFNGHVDCLPVIRCRKLEPTMYTFELSLQYRKAVKDRDLDAVLSVFCPNASIVTPLKGSCDVRTYHEWLFATVKRSSLKVINAFQALNGEICLAVLADYEWIMHDDKVLNFTGMSVFDFTPDKMKIKTMRTFYDPSIVRPQLDALNIASVE
jgi:hypothetical protein